MGGDGGVLGGIGEFLFGDPTEAARDAASQSGAYTTQAMQIQKEMAEKSLAVYQQMMEKALAASQQGQQQAIAATLAGQQGGTAATLAGSQVNADLLKYAAGLAQSAQAPLTAARLGALQSLPMLQQFIGAPAYNIPTSVETTPMPGVNYINAYNSAFGALSPTFQQMASQAGVSPTAQAVPAGAGIEDAQIVSGPDVATATLKPTGTAGATTAPAALPGPPAEWKAQWLANNPMFAGALNPAAVAATAPAATTPAATGIVTPTSVGNITMTPTVEAPAAAGAAVTPAAKTELALSPYTGATYQYQETPIYKLQQEMAERNTNRALAARGIATGAPAAAVLGQVNRELAATEADKAYSRLMDQVNIGLGYQPTSAGASGAASLGNVYTGLGSNLASSLSNLGTSLANTATTGAANRAGLYQNLGTGTAQAYTGMGSSQAQGLMSLAQQQNALANTIASTPTAGQQLLNLGMTAYGAGMFGGTPSIGTGTQFPSSTYAIPSIYMQAFSNPYSMGL